MIRFFAAHPTAANLLMLILAVMGLSALPSLQRATFPKFQSEVVEVRVVYPGASAADVEEAICRRIEDSLDGLGDRDEIVSEAREGVCSVRVKMVEGGDLQAFMDDIKSEVDAITEFPDQAESPIVEQLGRSDQVISVAVTGEMSPPELKAYANDLKERLQRVPEVSQVNVLGFSDRQIRVEIPVTALMQYGLSVADVSGMISRQSVDLPAGSIESNERDVVLRFTDERRSPEEFEDLVIVGSSAGGEIRLGQIASIRDVFELDEERIVFNGRRAVVLQILKTEQQDTLRVFDAVKRFVDDERASAPPGVSFHLTQDLASVVRERLQLLVENGIAGLVLVFITLWLFFNTRVAFWVVMGLPVSFLGALYFLPVIDYTINMITMVGLLLALGLLMDDAIVIAENVAAHHAKGKTGLEAAFDGVKEVGVGVLSSFLTTVAVFGPLAFITGNIGKVMRVMPVVLILVLTVSIIEAFLILPNHLGHALGHSNDAAPSRFRRRFEAIFESVRERVVGRIVDRAIAWRYVTVGLAIGAFLVSAAMLSSGHLKFQSFPDVDGDTLMARVLLPQGTRLEQTEAVVTKITDGIESVNDALQPEQPGGERLVRNVSVQYNVNSDSGEVGPHLATVTVDLLGAEQRNARIDDVLNRWRAEVGTLSDVLSIKYGEPAVGPAGLPIDIRLYGDDLDELKAASIEMQDWLNLYEGVQDVSDDLRLGKPEVQVRLREGATGLGLTAEQLASQLRAAFFGSTAAELQVGDEAYEVDVRLAPRDQDSLGDLESFRVTLPSGQQVPLGDVAHLEEGRGYARIVRVDGRRAVSVQGDVDTSALNTAELIAELKAELVPSLAARYPQVEVSVEGEAKETATTGRSLSQGLLIGLIGVFVLLSFQFKSYTEPLTVMAAIPMAFIGVVWGHLLMGFDLTMPSMVGFASLAGIVVNDAILLMEFIKLREREGADPNEAARQASRDRFRAILLTSLTTIAGLLPLLAERSMQAQFLIPLTASIVFGLAASTALVLVVVPSLYAIVSDFKA